MNIWWILLLFRLTVASTSSNTNKIFNEVIHELIATTWRPRVEYIIEMKLEISIHDKYWSYHRLKYRRFYTIRDVVNFPYRVWQIIQKDFSMNEFFARWWRWLCTLFRCTDIRHTETIMTAKLMICVKDHNASYIYHSFLKC